MQNNDGTMVVDANEPVVESSPDVQSSEIDLSFLADYGQGEAFEAGDQEEEVEEKDDELPDEIFDTVDLENSNGNRDPGSSQSSSENPEDHIENEDINEDLDDPNPDQHQQIPPEVIEDLRARLTAEIMADLKNTGRLAPGNPAFQSSSNAIEHMVNGVAGLIGGSVTGAAKGLYSAGKKGVALGKNAALFGRDKLKAMKSIPDIKKAVAAWRENEALLEQEKLAEHVSSIAERMGLLSEDPVIGEINQRIADNELSESEAREEITARLSSDDPEIADTEFNRNYQALMEELKAMRNNDWLGTEERLSRSNEMTAQAAVDLEEQFESLANDPLLKKLPEETEESFKAIKEAIANIMKAIRKILDKFFGPDKKSDDLATSSTPSPSM